jgi:hypothetical protein
MADENNEQPASLDMGERHRTWRLFIAMIKWNLLALAALLFFLLVFRTHGG